MKYFDELEDQSYYNKIMYTFEKIHILLAQRVDMATMAASVEARVPFVDHRLVEFALLSLKYKLKWFNAKAQDESITLMIQNSRIMIHPNTLKRLQKVFTDNILHGKNGISVPLNKWFGGDFNNYAKKLLLSEEAKSRGLYNIDNVKN